MLQDLADAVRDHRAILFVGAGLSMSVGLPSWREFIDHLISELQLDPEQVGQDFSYQTLAEYYRISQGSIGPLRSWLDRAWSVSEDKVRQSEVHKLLVDLDFPIIYTTNYVTT